MTAAPDTTFHYAVSGAAFCSLSGAIRFAVAKRNRRLRRRFSRGCATTNAIVLMTLLSKCPRTFSKQYHKYRRSPRGRLSPCTPFTNSSEKIFYATSQLLTQSANLFFHSCSFDEFITSLIALSRKRRTSLGLA